MGFGAFLGIAGGLLGWSSSRSANRRARRDAEKWGRYNREIDMRSLRRMEERLGTQQGILRHTMDLERMRSEVAGITTRRLTRTADLEAGWNRDLSQMRREELDRAYYETLEGLGLEGQELQVRRAELRGDSRLLNHDRQVLEGKYGYRSRELLEVGEALTQERQALRAIEGQRWQSLGLQRSLIGLEHREQERAIQEASTRAAGSIVSNLGVRGSNIGSTLETQAAEVEAARQRQLALQGGRYGAQMAQIGLAQTQAWHQFQVAEEQLDVREAEHAGAWYGAGTDLSRGRIEQGRQGDVLGQQWQLAGMQDSFLYSSRQRALERLGADHWQSAIEQGRGELRVGEMREAAWEAGISWDERTVKLKQLEDALKDAEFSEKLTQWQLETLPTLPVTTGGESRSSGLGMLLGSIGQFLG